MHPNIRMTHEILLLLFFNDLDTRIPKEFFHMSGWLLKLPRFDIFEANSSQFKMQPWHACH